MGRDRFFRLALLATILTLVVVVLGAFVRLSDAGLGCPDWPGCYGHLDVPRGAQEIEQANANFPDRPVEAHKAWKEMVHRYFAGALGLLIFILAWMAVRRRQRPGQPWKIPVLLVGVVIFQALLGMWTVTIRLNPAIVMAHLLGGLATLSLLWWVVLRQGRWFKAVLDPWIVSRLRNPALIGLLLVILQIMLGGWTSANYAALQCSDTLLTCQGQIIPPLDFREAFTLWRGTELDFQGGVLDNTARATIQFTHRVMAVVVLIYLLWLGLGITLRSQYRPLRPLGLAILAAGLVQVSLGIANVVFLLPLPVAVAHNAGAAILLLTMVTLNVLVRHGGKHGIP